MVSTIDYVGIGLFSLLNSVFIRIEKEHFKLCYQVVVMSFGEGETKTTLRFSSK